MSTDAQSQIDKLPKQPEVRHRVVTGVAPYIEFELDSGAKVITEPYSLITRDSDITKTADAGSIGKAAQRALSKESIRQLIYKNEGKDTAKLQIEPRTTGEILEMELQDGDEVHYQQGKFFAATNDIDMGFRWHLKLKKTLLGAKGLRMQTITPKNKGELTRVFFNSSSQLIKRKVKPGDDVVLNGLNIVAYKGDIEFTPMQKTNLKEATFRDENFYTVRARGEGEIWMESRPNSHIYTINPIARLTKGLLSRSLLFGGLLIIVLLRTMVFDGGDPQQGFEDARNLIGRQP